MRGPGETQLESDRRQMKSKIAALQRMIDAVRNHRARHRRYLFILKMFADCEYQHSSQMGIGIYFKTTCVYIGSFLK